MLIAKSNGLGITTHSEIVKEFSLKIFERIIDDKSTQERFVDVVKYGALFHDIGKIVTKFQQLLKGKRKSSGLKYRHNEIAWAFLSKYLSENFLTLENREMVLNIVYWHHGVSPETKLCGNTDIQILSTIDEESIKNMLDYLTNCEGIEPHHINTYVDLSFATNTPRFYPNDKILNKCRNKLNLLRSIVITGDRNSSEYNSVSEITDELVDSYFEMSETIEIGQTKFDGSERFEEQKKIVNSITPQRTTIIKAPAGFGKTLIGTMWGFKTNQKIIWVLPINSVTISVYDAILKEFDNLNVNTSIQLILGGKIIKTNAPELGLYEANIIITNIDNFLGPNFKNSIMNISGLLFGADVIFDEYHELINDSASFALFIDIMRARNLLTKSSTLLLSATPTNCHRLWELGVLNKSTQTIILPNNETHFKPIHEKPYFVNTHTKSIDSEYNTTTICIKNTVKSAQMEKLNNNYDLLFHGNFTDEDKTYRYKQLMSNYGKDSEKGVDKPNIVGTHILQTSFDISFKRLIEDVLSPESTLQRFGRVNRWGELEFATADIIKDIDNPKIRSEITIKNILYSHNLSDMWFDYVVKRIKDKDTITLNDLYEMYNQFYIDNDKVLYEHFNNKLIISTQHLSNIYPIKFINKKGETKVKTAGSNKLRSINSEIFYIVQHENGKDWIGPFGKQIFKSLDVEFNEDSNTSNRIIKTMTKLRDSNDERFNFNGIIDNIKYNSLKKLGFKSDAPYIVYDRYYSDELGVVQKK